MNKHTPPPRRAPQAHSVQFGQCADPDCRTIHLLLLDVDGDTIATAEFGADTLQEMIEIAQRTLRGRT
jgi:hypothetical protein